jgi:hypothetical protein
LIEEPESPWFKVSKRKFKKIVACSRCKGFIKILFKNIWMTSKRAKNNQRFGRMNSLVIPLKELSNALATPLKGFKNIKKSYIMTPLRSFFHVMMFLYLLHLAHQWIYKIQQKEELSKEGGDCIESL